MQEMNPHVAVIMGSKSDRKTLCHSAEVLTRFDVPHECRIVSAHRTPVWMEEYASAAAGRGIEVIIGRRTRSEGLFLRSQCCMASLLNSKPKQVENQ